MMALWSKAGSIGDPSGEHRDIVAECTSTVATMLRGPGGVANLASATYATLQGLATSDVTDRVARGHEVTV